MQKNIFNVIFYFMGFRFYQRHTRMSFQEEEQAEVNIDISLECILLNIYNFDPILFSSRMLKEKIKTKLKNQKGKSNVLCIIVIYIYYVL